MEDVKDEYVMGNASVVLSDRYNNVGERAVMIQ